MERVLLEVPHMYADHHVINVRGILGKLKGVEEIYASSSFKQVEVGFEPGEISLDDIKAALGAEGYYVGEEEDTEDFGLADEVMPGFVAAHGVAAKPEDSRKFELPPWRDSVAHPCPGFDFRNIDPDA